MAILHLMVGLPCSGKTTYAKQLEKECHALRLTPDVWHLSLFGQDATEESHDKNHARIEKIMWDVAERVLSLGVDVILDFGCWAKEERDAFRKKAKSVGAGFQMHYTEVSEDELFRRLEIRNAAQTNETFVIPAAYMEKYMQIFQPPTMDEINAE